MYGLPGSAVQFGVKSAAKKRGRPSFLSKYLTKQIDLFPVDFFIAQASTACAPARSEARTDAQPGEASAAKKSEGVKSKKKETAGSSTPFQSQIRDFRVFSDAQDGR